jgi:hypothetical protein
MYLRFVSITMPLGCPFMSDVNNVAAEKDSEHSICQDAQAEFTVTSIHVQCIA